MTADGQNVEGHDRAQQAALGRGVQNNTFVVGAVADERVLPSVDLPLGLRGNSVFGRDVELDALGAVANGEVGGSVTVVHGVGGVGKTRLALEVALRAEEAGVRVWWVAANDVAAFEDGMRAVGYAAGATGEEFTRANPADVVWRTLNQLSQRWLLIVDNADDSANLAGQGPLDNGRGWIRLPGRRGAVLITSRDGREDQWANWIGRRLLEPLSAQASAEVLLNLAKDAGSADQARRLGERLSGMPLLLHLAGSSIKTAGRIPARWTAAGSPRTFSAYEEAIDSTDAGGPAGTSDLDQISQSAWEVSLRQLEQIGQPNARKVLLLVCCFADAPLPYEEILDPGTLANSDLLAGITPSELLQILNDLEQLGLVTLEPGQATDSRSAPADLTVHQVIRTAARAHPDLASNGAAYWQLAADLLLTAAESASDSIDAVQTWARLSAHAADTLGREPPDGAGGAPVTPADIAWRADRALRAGALRLAEYGLDAQALLLFDVLISGPYDGETRLVARHGRARILREGGRHAEALAEFDAIMAVRRAEAGDRSDNVLNIRQDIAKVLREMGRHGEALAELEGILSIRRAEYGDHHDYVLSARHSRARVLREMGRHAEALSEFDAMLPAQSGGGSDDQRDVVLDARGERARLLREIGRHGEALAEMDALLTARRARYGEQHDFVLTSREERARMLQSVGRHGEALAELDAVLSAWRARHGDEHNYVLITRVQRARALQSMGRHSEALAEFEAVLTIWRAEYGDQHNYVLIMRDERARLLDEMGRHGEALAELDGLLADWRARYGDQHNYVLITRFERARVLRDIGRHDEALAELDVLLTSWRAEYGHQHNYVLLTRRDRARVLQDLGRHSEALPEFEAVLASWRASYGDENDYVLVVRRDRARTLREVGRPGKALEELDAVVAARPAGQDDEHGYVLFYRQERARVLRVIGRHGEALEEINAVVAAQRAKHGDEHGYVLSARHDLARVLQDMGRHADALAEFDPVLTGRRSRQGDRHGSVLAVRHNRACSLYALGSVDEALSELEAVAEGRHQLHGADHRLTKDSRAAVEAVRNGRPPNPSD